MTSNPKISDSQKKPVSLDSAVSTNSGGAKTLRLALVALLCTSVVFGCAQIRKATYPGDYVYLERKQIRSKMALLSFYMQELDQILLDDSSVSSDQQQRILNLLNKIQDATAELGGGVTTNHRVIDDHIDQFKTDVGNAFRNASANPPNYYALGRLSGSCVGCHKYRE